MNGLTFDKTTDLSENRNIFDSFSIARTRTSNTTDSDYSTMWAYYINVASVSFSAVESLVKLLGLNANHKVYPAVYGSVVTNTTSTYAAAAAAAAAAIASATGTATPSTANDLPYMSANDIKSFVSGFSNKKKTYLEKFNTMSTNPGKMSYVYDLFAFIASLFSINENEIAFLREVPVPCTDTAFMQYLNANDLFKKGIRFMMLPFKSTKIPAIQWLDLFFHGYFPILVPQIYSIPNFTEQGFQSALQSSVSYVQNPPVINRFGTAILMSQSTKFVCQLWNVNKRPNIANLLKRVARMAFTCISDDTTIPPTEKLFLFNLMFLEIYYGGSFHMFDLSEKFMHCVRISFLHDKKYMITDILSAGEELRTQQEGGNSQAAFMNSEYFIKKYSTEYNIFAAGVLNDLGYNPQAPNLIYAYSMYIYGFLKIRYLLSKTIASVLFEQQGAVSVSRDIFTSKHLHHDHVLQFESTQIIPSKAYVRIFELGNSTPALITSATSAAAAAAAATTTTTTAAAAAIATNTTTTASSPPATYAAVVMNKPSSSSFDWNIISECDTEVGYYFGERDFLLKMIQYNYIYTDVTSVFKTKESFQAFLKTRERNMRTQIAKCINIGKHIYSITEMSLNRFWYYFLPFVPVSMNEQYRVCIETEFSRQFAKIPHVCFASMANLMQDRLEAQTFDQYAKAVRDIAMRVNFLDNYITATHAKTQSVLNIEILGKFVTNHAAVYAQDQNVRQIRMLYAILVFLKYADLNDVLLRYVTHVDKKNVAIADSDITNQFAIIDTNMSVSAHVFIQLVIFNVVQ
jgi:hypothetical protein